MNNSTRIGIVFALIIALVVVLQVRGSKPSPQAAQEAPEPAVAVVPDAEQAPARNMDEVLGQIVDESGADTLPPEAQGAVDAAPAGGEKLPRLLSLGAGWCVPCKMMDPVREELREKYSDNMVVEYIDVGENEAAARSHNIRIIPTLIFYDAQGKELERREGYMSTEDVLKVFAEQGIKISAD